MVPPTRQQVLVACVAALLLLAGVGAAMRGAGTAPDRSQRGPVFTTAGRDGIGSGDELLVDVAGEVRSPGVYRLSGESRVIDALERAGGTTAEADLSSVNRAAPLVDGQQVIVPAVATATQRAVDASAGIAGAAMRSPPVSINAADAAALDTLDGIGPATAAKIVADRQANGPFASIDELDRVPGIGPATVEALRSSVTL